jgi:hypothetical protein
MSAVWYPLRTDPRTSCRWMRKRARPPPASDAGRRPSSKRSGTNAQPGAVPPSACVALLSAAAAAATGMGCWTSRGLRSIQRHHKGVR